MTHPGLLVAITTAEVVDAKIQFQIPPEGTIVSF